MKILHISDTHSLHSQLQGLPKADVIVHSGDFTFAGTENEAMDFLGWFCELPYPYKVLIAGNHDDCLYGANIDGLPDNCYYLNGSGVTEGRRRLMTFEGVCLRSLLERMGREHGRLCKYE